MGEAFHEKKHGREPCVPSGDGLGHLTVPTRGAAILPLPQGVVPNKTHSLIIHGVLRICSDCRHARPLTQFVKNRNLPQGRASICRECAKMRGRAYRKEHPEGNRTSCLKYRLSHPGVHNQLCKEWAKRNPLAAAARLAVFQSRRSGRLLMPDTCDRCGKPAARPIFHHADYTRPLWGTTLCRSCHRKVHGARNLSP